MRLQRLFLEHPESVGEGYWEHFRAAMSFSANLFAAAIVCTVHALLPFLFAKTGSGIIEKLHDRMCVNRATYRKAASPASTGEAVENAGA